MSAQAQSKPDPLFHGLCGWVPAVILHPDTAPEAIAKRQRADVAVARRTLGDDVRAIAEAVVLPAWVVQRRLSELTGKKIGKPIHCEKQKQGSPMRALIVAFLKEREPQTVDEIAEALGRSADGVRCCLYTNWHLFRRVGKRKVKFSQHGTALWTLVKKEDGK